MTKARTVPLLFSFEPYRMNSRLLFNKARYFQIDRIQDTYAMKELSELNVHLILFRAFIRAGRLAALIFQSALVVVETFGGLWAV